MSFLSVKQGIFGTSDFYVAKGMMTRRREKELSELRVEIRKLESQIRQQKEWDERMDAILSRVGFRHYDDMTNPYDLRFNEPTLKQREEVA